MTNRTRITAGPLTLALALAAAGLAGCGADPASPAAAAGSPHYSLAAGLVSGGTYRLISALSTSGNQECLDVAGGVATAGTNVQIYTCNNLAPQNWVVTEVPGSFATLKSAVSTSGNALCLDVTDGKVTKGTNVRIWTCNNQTPQAWKIEANGDGTYKLRVQAANYTTSGEALDVASANSAAGTNVQLYDDLGNAAQRWRLERVDGGSTGGPTGGSTGGTDTPAGNPSGWTQTFNDDFNAIDGAKWHRQWYCQSGAANCWFSGRFESVYPDANTFASGGSLNLVTKRESYTNTDGKVYQYTAGALSTAERFTQQYGYFEARLKPASTNGNDPDFWLASPKGWPPEIDIAEFPGAYAGRSVGLSLHAGANDSQKSDGYKLASDLGAASFNDAYHTYGLLWDADKLVWYIDGQEVRRYTGSAVPQEPMYVIFSDENRTDGGGWFGDPSKGTYPQTTLVDWVRVYKRK